MSKTVIDALLITLGIDASDFKKGQKEASDAIKKTVDDANKAADAIEDAEKRKVDAVEDAEKRKVDAVEDAEKRKVDAGKGSKKQREHDQKFIVESEKKTDKAVEEVQKGAEKKVIKREKDALGRRKKDNEETKRGDKEVEAHAAQAANFLGKFSSAALKVASVVAAVKTVGVVESILESDSAMSKLARTSGVAYDNMKAYATLANANGGSELAGSQTIRNFVGNWEDQYFNGNNAQIAQIRGMLIKTEDLDANGKMVPRNAMDILGDLAAYASEKTLPEATYRLGQAGFNQDDARILHDLGRDGFKDAIEQQKKYNRISDETGKNAEELSRSFTNMNTAMEGLIKTLGSPLIKELTGIFDTITKKASEVQVPGAEGNIMTDLGDSPLAKFIGQHEGDYDSVNLGIEHGYKSAKRPLESMMLSEVMTAQNNREFNAAGRYQVVRDNLIEASSALKLNGNEKFDKTMQDKIFEYIIKQKRPAIYAAINGSGSLEAGYDAASKEWAFMANQKTGKSNYDGIANNKATATYEEGLTAFRDTLAQLAAKNKSVVGPDGIKMTGAAMGGNMPDANTVWTDVDKSEYDMNGAYVPGKLFKPPSMKSDTQIKKKSFFNSLINGKTFIDSWIKESGYDEDVMNEKLLKIREKNEFDYQHDNYNSKKMAYRKPAYRKIQT